MIDKGDSMERILQAARDEFADKGYEGARIDEIARKAGINKAMLYYHVGDKKALYAAAIQSVVGRGAVLVADAVSKSSTPREKLIAYVRGMFEMIGANPQMPRIMLREIASGGKNLPDGFFPDLLKVIMTVTGIMDEGVKKGVFIETVPALIHIMTLGMLVSIHTVSPVLCSMPQAPAELKGIFNDVIGKVGTEIERLILRSVLAGGRKEVKK
jgi:AcrR family transcriptional regulator